MSHRHPSPQPMPDHSREILDAALARKVLLADTVWQQHPTIANGLARNRSVRDLYGVDRVCASTVEKAVRRCRAYLAPAEVPA